MKNKTDKPDHHASGEISRAVIYARVSSKEQEKEGFSIPAQLKLLKEYVANVHLKDYGKPLDQSTACLAGDGIAYVREILAGLKELEYDGCFTIEPHMRMTESFHYSGKEDYIRAGQRIKELLSEAGFKVEMA